MRGVDIVTLVQFPLDVWQSDHYGQVLPHVALPQLQCLPYLLRCTKCCSGHFSIPHAKHPLTFQTVEVLCEAAAESAEVVSLDEEGEEGVDFVEGVEDAEEVAGMSVCCDGEKVAQRGRYECCELLF